MKPKVVAFLGRAGSGKSTAAAHLINTYGAKRVSFAGPLKELAKLLVDFNDDQVYGSQEAKEAVDPRYGFTPRQFLQRLGNGAREVISKTVWVDACINTILKGYKEVDASTHLWVIDDCRYVNEASYIWGSQQIYGHVVKLECPDAQTAADPNHPSEAEVDLVPDSLLRAKIVSKRSPGSVDLLSKIDDVVAELGLGRRVE